MEYSSLETRKNDPGDNDHGSSPRREIPRRLVVQARSLAEALTMGLAAAVIALTVNWLRSDSLPLVRRAPFDIFTDCPEISDHLPAVTAASIGPHPKGVVFVDGRKAWDYCKGHIPNAVFLPMYETEEPDPATVQSLRRSKGRWIVVYGDATVAGGKRLTSALISAGLRGLHLLKGGLEAWKQAGFPLERCTFPTLHSNSFPMESGGFILVDPRPAEAFEKGHAPRSVNLPFDDVLPPDPGVLARLLASKKPIVVSDWGTRLQNGMAPAWAVAAELKARGARNVSILVQPARNDHPGASMDPAGRKRKQP